jgi:hypothetical protein
MSVVLVLRRFEFSMSNAPCKTMMVHISSIPHEDVNVISRVQFLDMLFDAVSGLIAG